MISIYGYLTVDERQRRNSAFEMKNGVVEDWCNLCYDYGINYQLLSNVMGWYSIKNSGQVIREYPEILTKKELDKESETIINDLTS